METRSTKRKQATSGASDSVLVASPKVQLVADWLQSDIRRRGLRAGDRYLTSEEAATELDVSTGTAHQAMRLLVDQQVLQRTRKRGTYIGSAVEPPNPNKRPRVYVLLPADATRDGSYARLSESLYPAISAAFGGASLQLEYLPRGDSLGFVRTLVDEADTAGNLGGFLLMRSTFEIQDFFQEHRARYPAVVVGSVYPGITMLPSADADQGAIGEDLAARALRAGHRRVAVLLYEHWAPGDSRLMSSIVETFATSAKRLERFEVCSLPAYEQAIRARVKSLLVREDRPTAIIARMALQVRMVFEVAKEVGLRIPDDLDVEFANLRQQLPPGISIPHFDADLDISRIAEMLVATRDRKPLDSPTINYPVRFIESY